MSEITILHLSDIHFKKNGYQGYKSFYDNVQQKLIYKVAEQSQKQENPEFVIVTGDIAFSGKKEEYDRAMDFFKRLRAILPAKTEFLVVPGNHDVNRQEINKIFSLHKIVENNQVDEFLEKKENIINYVNVKFKSYRKFSKQLNPVLYQSKEDYFWVKNIPEKDVSILGLNSVWASENEKDRFNIALGYHQLMAALKKSTQKNRIVLLHHPPINWLKDMEIGRTWIELSQNCHLLFHGHNHSDNALVFLDPSNSVICLGANASYTKDENGSIGFQFIKALFLKEGRSVKMTVWPYIYNEKRNEFVPDRERWKFQNGKPYFVIEKNEFSEKIVLAFLDTPAKYRNWILLFNSRLDIVHSKYNPIIPYVTLPEVYITIETANPLLKKLKNEENMEERSNCFGKEVECQKPFFIDIEELVSYQKCILLRGAAGMGKTTLIKHLAYSIIQGYGPVSLHDYLPIVVFLKNIWPIFQEEISSKKTDITFKSLLQKYFETHLGGTLNFEEVKRFLSRERALFLIDGLDEVPERLRCSLVELIVTFRVEYINNHFLLTSRPHGIDAGIMSYLGEYLCDIEYLDKKKINEFISNLLKVVSRQNVDYARVSVTEMISDIKFHKHADVFTRNPLFLTALCFFYLENGKQLPIQRADLYDSIIRNFLSRRFNDLSDPEKVTRIEDYLKHLAFLMQEQDRKIIEVGKAKELLKEYFPHKDESPSHYKIRIDNLYAEIEPRCGLLKCTCEAELEFIHSTFQEFMAAWHMLYTDTDYKKYLKNSGWHETILFYTSLISREHKERANLMVNEFLSNPPNDTDGTQKLWLLGAKVLRDIQPNRRDSKVIYLAREKMKTILESEAPLEERFEAGEILGILGDDRIKSYPIVVNGGAFFRGSNKYKWEKPSGNIDLDGFMMAKYPVTNTEFACFIQDGGYNNKDFWCSDGWTWKEIKKISAPMFWYDRKWNGLNFPVVGVNWYEAKAYTMWLNKKTGDEYTLPTEAQWEKAARGSEGFIYPWGKEFNKNLCNTSESRLNRTSPVGIFPGGKSPFGCFDMAGNVWEWCLDWYDEYYYKNSPGKNPEGPVSGNFRVIRGGSWFNEAWRCLGSFRDYDEPEDRLNCLGFRLVKKLKVTDINATPNINGDSIVVKPANNNFQDHEKVFKDELKGQSVKVELFKKREEDRKSVKKILIISSNPKTTPRIQFDEEIKEIEEALGRSKYRDQFEILSKLRVSFKVLRRALLDHDPQIVHFIGHGNEDGLLLEDEFGLAVPISPEVLSGLFKLFSDKVEFIILNACYSELQANVIIEHINYVIGMRGEIKDKASIEFTVGFYDALGAGKSVEESFKFGCNAIQQMFPNLPEHLIPILKKRGNLRKL